MPFYDLERVARAQKVVLAVVLAHFALYAAVLFAPPAGVEILLGWLVVRVLVLISLARLLVALNWSGGTGVFVALLGLLPCLSLFILLWVNQQATNALKKEGVRVGLFGADLKELE